MMALLPLGGQRMSENHRPAIILNAMAGQETSFDLLSPEGVVTVTFSGKLTEEQYSELYRATRGAENQLELKTILLMIAAEWEMKAQFN